MLRGVIDLNSVRALAGLWLFSSIASYAGWLVFGYRHSMTLLIYGFILMPASLVLMAAIVRRLGKPAIPLIPMVNIMFLSSGLLWCFWVLVTVAYDTVTCPGPGN